MCRSTSEELARGYRLKNALGDLFAAAVVQFNERIGGESASDAILRQAQVFDAIAKVIDEVKEPSMIIARLAPSILDLVRDDNLLPELQRRGVSEAAIEELAPTALFASSSTPSTPTARSSCSSSSSSRSSWSCAATRA